MKRYLFLISIILVAVITALISTVISYENALKAADNFLESQSLGIAASLDSAISKYGTKENIFTDIIEEGRWEGIAFLGLYSKDGLTMLHSNQNLINKKIDDTDIKKTVDSGELMYKYTTLGTGEEIFLLNYPVHLNESIMALRVALHTYPANAIVREARFHLLSILTVLLVLSSITGCFLITLRKKERLEKILLEKEKLSLIGEMASVLAHEIRNPLGSIKGFAQYLKEQVTGQKPQDRELTESYLDIIVTESRRIERLTEDLLIYSRRDELMLERFDLPLIINEVLSLLAVPSNVSVKLDIADGISISSDRNKLRQILTNLIQNSLDAITETGEIRIKAKEQGNNVMLTVSDSGAGIPDNEIGRIFKPFYTTKTKGTGLGLAIVERYVKALGGKLAVESTIGNGSTFSITIPKRQ
jgi:two-component system sensor histidine kinase HydH